jgi:hypothetical protein
MKKQVAALGVFLALLAALSPAPAAGQAATSLKAVTFLKTEKGLDVTIGVEGEFLYQAQTLANPTRLAVDLSPLSKIDAQAFYDVNQAGLTSIRTGQFTPLIARVVIDFSGAMPGYEIVKTGAGLVIRFAGEAKPAVAPPPVREQPVPQRPVQIVKPVEGPAETGTAETREGFANTMIGAQMGSYQIPSSEFKEIYGPDAAQTFGFSLSRTLIQSGGLSLDVEGGIRFFSKDGASTLSQEVATFKMTPISLAGRLNYQWKYFQVFVGYGLDWYSYTETSAIANTTGNANGNHFTAGIYLIPPLLDGLLRLKVYYKFTKVTALENGVSIDLGGNEYGVGLSFGFNILKKGVLAF